MKELTIKECENIYGGWVNPLLLTVESPNTMGFLGNDTIYKYNLLNPLNENFASSNLGSNTLNNYNFL